jgi:competence protein ComEC
MPLQLHFLNVGEGDCTVIEFPSGNLGIVDISNVKTLDTDSARELILSEARDQGVTASQMDEAFMLEAIRKAAAATTDALDYIDENIGRNATIFRLIISHPHMDHISGLHRLATQEPKTVLNFWHAGFDNFDLDEADWGSWKYKQEDWNTYKALRNSEEAPKALVKRQGAQGQYWTEDEVEIWAPTEGLVATAVAKNDQNILSAILKISHAGRSILLGGDATGAETWPTIYPDLDMTGIDVLKASHHGRNSGYYYPAVKEMSPWLTITSVGDPQHDATKKYGQYSDYTVSLRKTGTIVITIKDDGTLVYPSNLKDHWQPKSA